MPTASAAKPVDAPAPLQEYAACRVRACFIAHQPRSSS